MSWRKWFVRALMVAVVLFLAGGYYIYHRWTNPEAIRQLALSMLHAQLPGAAVQLTSAEVRLFGGVHLHDLRIISRTGPTGEPVLILPETILYPDREQLTAGKLVVQRVLLKRPKLQLVRNTQGEWNVEGLACNSCQSAGENCPLVEVQDATVVFLDHLTGSPPLHLVEVHALLKPGQGRNLLLQMRGSLSGEAQVQVQGTVNLSTSDAQVRLTVQELALGRHWQQRLAAYFPEMTDCLKCELAGRAHVQAELAYHPESEIPFTYQFSAQLQRGSLRLPDCPFPLEEVEASLRQSAGEIILEECRGKLQKGTFAVSGAFRSREQWHLKGAAKDLLLQPDLYAKLPEPLKGLCLDFQPHGGVSVSGQIRQLQQARQLEYTIQPQRLVMTFAKFPYPVTDLAGSMQYTEALGQPRMLVHLNGKASAEPVSFRGQLYGEGLLPENPATAGIDLTIAAQNVPLDPKLEAALLATPDVLDIVRRLRAKGLVDLKIHLRRPAGSLQRPMHETSTHVICDVHHAAFQYEKFPLALENASAHVEFLPDGHWKFDRLEGTHQGGKVTGRGALRDTTEGPIIDLDFEGERLPLNAELFAALPPATQRAWRQFNPEGRFNCIVRADFPLQRPMQIEVDIMPLGCRILPACFPYRLENVQGLVQFARETVTIHKFSAKHKNGVIRLEKGTVHLKKNNCHHTELTNLQWSDLQADEELHRALPPALSGALRALRPSRPLEAALNLVIDVPHPTEPPRVGWNGYVQVSQCTLHAGVALNEVTGRVSLRGTHDGHSLACTGDIALDQVVLARQPFRNVGAKLHITDAGMTLQELRGALHGGRIDGILQVNWTDPPMYDLAFRAEQIELEEFARRTLERSGQARGKVNASMKLKGQGRDLRNLVGQASFRVAQGARLYDLPLVFELLNYMGSRLPQGTLFQDASAELTIEGEKIGVKQLELVSEAITLRGQGEMRIDGSNLNLEMYGLPWGRRIPLLPPIIDKIPTTVSKQLMKIRARGSLTAVKILPEPVPIVVEPFKEMLRNLTDVPSDR